MKETFSSAFSDAEASAADYNVTSLRACLLSRTDTGVVMQALVSFKRKPTFEEKEQLLLLIDRWAASADADQQQAVAIAQRLLDQAVAEAQQAFAIGQR